MFTGKSSLLLRFTDDDFLAASPVLFSKGIPKADLWSGVQGEETSATIGVDFKVKQLEVDGRKYKLSIWVSRVCCL